MICNKGKDHGKARRVPEEIDDGARLKGKDEKRSQLDRQIGKACLGSAAAKRASNNQ